LRRRRDLRELDGYSRLIPPRLATNHRGTQDQEEKATPVLTDALRQTHRDRPADRRECLKHFETWPSERQPGARIVNTPTEGIGVEGCYRNFANHTFLVLILHRNSDPSQILETLQVNRTKVPSLLACSSRIRVASPEQSSSYRLFAK
jgi:hypothetical protein